METSLNRSVISFSSRFIWAPFAFDLWLYPYFRTNRMPTRFFFQSRSLRQHSISIFFSSFRAKNVYIFLFKPILTLSDNISNVKFFDLVSLGIFIFTNYTIYICSKNRLKSFSFQVLNQTENSGKRKIDSTYKMEWIN